MVLFIYVPDEGYSVLCSSGKHPAISRIIWSCDWTWDSRYFVTGSRDKRVVMWGLMENSDPVFQVKSKFDAADSVTSVSVLKIKRESIHLLAAGFEKGEIALLTFDVFTNKIALVHTLPTYEYPFLVTIHCVDISILTLQVKVLWVCVWIWKWWVLLLIWLHHVDCFPELAFQHGPLHGSYKTVLEAMSRPTWSWGQWYRVCAGKLWGRLLRQDIFSWNWHF